MVAGPRVLSPGHARRSRLCDESQRARREIARNRTRRPLEEVTNELLDRHVRFHTEIAPANHGDHGAHITPTDHVVEIENLENERDVENECNATCPNPHIIIGEGDFSKVTRYCLSIRYVYPNTSIAMHSSMLPIMFGKCLVHKLGGLDFVCSFCGAAAWKVEGKSIHTFVGKYCCSSGKVRLLPLFAPPIELRDLMQSTSARGKNFLKNIRAYNNALAFASLGAHVDETLSRGRGVYTFKVHGSIYHSIGPLMPPEGSNEVPRFAQLYFFDTEHELLNRLHHAPHVDVDVLESLQSMMHRENPYANALRSASSIVNNSQVPEVKMVIVESRSNGWQYLAPRGAEIAAIMPGQGDERNIGHRDIVINFRDAGLKRISSMHRSYMSLLYVLLFPRGEDGWHTCMQGTDGKKITQKQYYSFRLQIRHDTIQCLLRGGRLLQQYIVDAYSTVEDSRLLWLRNNQRTLRVEVYQGLADMVEARDGFERVRGANIGRRIVLPSSFVGGPRYMCQLYQDAMAIVQKRGKPDLFITFTCNPRWKEIEDALLPGQSASDRPDLTTRVFYQKFKDMMRLLTKQSIFGNVIGHVSVIEFQKRGLPHAHILLILAPEHKPVDVAHYDRFVCAELPDKQLFPELYDVISHCNVHGPCGLLNPNAPCMIDGKCRFKYPRKFCASTNLDNSGYPTYMRRDNGSFVKVKDMKLDNRWIVPYNPFLSLRYKAHINVEVCSTITAVKYLYKYVYKGHDRATIVLQDAEGTIDEIKNYLDARYVSASEAVWRIYGFDMHEEKPDIQRLQVHLPFQNIVTFQDSDDLQELVNDDVNRKTSLTEWFVANQNHPEANNLPYVDFPTEWVWNKSWKSWTRRQQGDTIGRMYNIVPTAGDLYYLRILLITCKGCKSYEELWTFNGQVYATFREACNARGLLQNDEEWFVCLEEASLLQSGTQLRQLFVVILTFCEPISPAALWDRFCVELSEDYIHALQVRMTDASVCIDVAKNQALSNIEWLLHQYGKRLCDYPGMPLVDLSLTFLSESGILAEETMFNVTEEANIAMHMESSLNNGQRHAYNEVLQAIERNVRDVFFLDGPGGSGKTYLYNTLLSRVRGHNKVALACASSGIAALLLKNGRTAHSRFKIPLELNSESTCNIKVNSQLAELLRRTSLIIWDEAPMTHRYAFEALDKTLRDVMQQDVLFGGKVILFGGDFRQILPVVRKGSRADIVDASLCNSYIWKCTKVLRLTENMRVLNCLSDMEQNFFSRWVLDIGNGNVHDGGIADNVALPASMLLQNNSLPSLIEAIYGDLQTLGDHANFFKERAILAPKNKEVDLINAYAVRKMCGHTKEYLSADSTYVSEDNTTLYPIEFLNSLDLGGGFPPHILILKENAPIMLLRNLDPRRGLCNGTRLICKQFHRRIIEAEIITGSNIGERILIPRIEFLIGSSEGLPFQMKRRQFPVRLAFGMTINKAQGQTLGCLGLYLDTPVFSHGQLYVALSRVRTSATLKVVVEKNDQTTSSHTPNIVFKEVLQLTSA